MNDDALKYYSKNKKWYHTVEHLENLYFLYDIYKEQFKEEFPELNEEKLYQTIDFHDCVYKPGSSSNEEDSVLNYISTGRMDKEVIDCILSTKVNNKFFNNSLEKVMHDLDWSGFRDYNSMLDNEKKILNEAVEKGKYTPNEALEGQKKFYQMIKDKDLYVTKTFKKFNNIAKRNIKRRIEELGD